jgi:DNA-binding transcriptional regulator YiaG
MFLAQGIFDFSAHFSLDLPIPRCSISQSDTSTPSRNLLKEQVAVTGQEFADLRRALGKSQSEIARLLSVSPRSIQAYEQGWRRIPSYIEASALYLMYELNRNETDMPCWKIRECPSAWREQCPCWEFQASGPCWFVNGTFCEGTFHRSWEEKMEACRSCKVLADLLPKKSKRYSH